MPRFTQASAFLLPHASIQGLGALRSPFAFDYLAPVSCNFSTKKKKKDTARTRVQKCPRRVPCPMQVQHPE